MTYGINYTKMVFLLNLIDGSNFKTVHIPKHKWDITVFHVKLLRISRDVYTLILIIQPSLIECVRAINNVEHIFFVWQ